MGTFSVFTFPLSSLSPLHNGKTSYSLGKGSLDTPFLALEIAQERTCPLDNHQSRSPATVLPIAGPSCLYLALYHCHKFVRSYKILLSAYHVLEHHLALCHFRFAHDGNERYLLGIGILHLLLHFG